VAATKTSRNETPDTPDVDESKIARMKVAELRRELKSRGVKNTEELKKPDLVNKLIKAELKSSRLKSSPGSKKDRNPTSHNDTPNTPGVDESKIARLKVGELRSRLADRGVSGTADLKKPELVKKLIKTLTSGKGKASAGKASTGKASVGKASASKASASKASASKASASKASASKASASKASAGKASAGKASTSKASVKASAGKASASKASAGKASTSKASASKAPTGGKASSNGGKRTGKKTSSSLRYSQEITSTEQRPERLGRSLVTTDHEVIRQWAKARKAVPSTVAGTEHDGHLGVLRFDFPGYDENDRLVEVSWAEWFEAFDKRRLNFIYQQRLTNGKRSNFFQLENPDE
jgi:hypothetical protein